MNKKEEVKNLYNKFEHYAENAEQHEFVTLFVMYKKITAAYNDLTNNWDEDHADIFIRTVNKVLYHFGVR